MHLHELEIKGIARYLIDDRLTGEPIHMHISVVGPGERAHAAHQHPGYEAFYIFEGQGTVELDGKLSALHAGEALVFDSTRLHGLVTAPKATALRLHGDAAPSHRIRFERFGVRVAAC